MNYLWLARFFSFFSEHLCDSVIALLVWHLTQNPLLAGFALASGRIALWLAGLKSGYIADRFNANYILIRAMIITSACYWFIAVMSDTNHLTAISLATLNFIAMLAKTFEYPAVNSLLSRVRSSSDFKKYNSFIDGSKRWARVVSPIAFLMLMNYQDDLTSILFLIAICYSIVWSLYLLSSKNAYFYSNASIPESINKVAFSSKNFTISFFVVCIFFGLYNLVYSSVFIIFLPKYFSIIDSNKEYAFSLFSISAGGIVGNYVYRWLSVSGSFNSLGLSIAIVAASCVLLAIAKNNHFIFFAMFIAGAALPVMDMSVTAIIRNEIATQYHGTAFSIFRLIADFGIICGSIFGAIATDSIADEDFYFASASWLFFIIVIYLFVIKKLKNGYTTA